MKGQLYKRRYGLDPSRGEDCVGYLLVVGDLSVAITSEQIYPTNPPDKLGENKNFIREIEIPEDLYEELWALAQSQAEYQEKIKKAEASLRAFL